MVGVVGVYPQISGLTATELICRLAKTLLALEPIRRMVLWRWRGLWRGREPTPLFHGFWYL